ncbi:MAG: aspartate-semialdehyde dehydrogenase [Gemmatimonadota bacterium]
MTRIPVAVLGATGAVGQKLLHLLADHPMFEVTQVVASAERIGRAYGEEVRWREANRVPARVGVLRFTGAEPLPGVRLAFSALDAPVARELEPRFATAGVMVVSNASAFRMDADVPLLIPEINADHLVLLDRQRAERGWTGGIITNPNCSTSVLAMALAPIHQAFGIRTAVVATLQAASGAGYPGVPSLDLLDNVIPYIGGEEPKIESECARILGQFADGAVTPASFAVSAMVHRVAVTDGHLVSVSIGLERPASLDEVREALATFRGHPDARQLPSSPQPPVVVLAEDDRPQPRRDRDTGGGMTVSVGRIRPCPVHDIRLVALGHNLVRGAAGAAIQNAELLVAQGKMKD